MPPLVASEHLVFPFSYPVLPPTLTYPKVTLSPIKSFSVKLSELTRALSSEGLSLLFTHTSIVIAVHCFLKFFVRVSGVNFFNKNCMPFQIFCEICKLCVGN